MGLSPRSAPKLSNHSPMRSSTRRTARPMPSRGPGGRGASSGRAYTRSTAPCTCGAVGRLACISGDRRPAGVDDARYPLVRPNGAARGVARMQGAKVRLHCVGAGDSRAARHDHGEGQSTRGAPGGQFSGFPPLGPRAEPASPRPPARAGIGKPPASFTLGNRGGGRFSRSRIGWMGTTGSGAPRRRPDDPHPFPKNADGPLPHPTCIPFPISHAGSCLVDRDAMPPLTRTPRFGGEPRKRRDNPLLFLCCLCFLRVRPIRCELRLNPPQPAPGGGAFRRW
jgi:hypothetical protein